MVTLTDTVYEDLLTIAEHIDVSEGGLERFFDGMDNAEKRTTAIRALLEAARPAAVRAAVATLSDVATYRAEHPHLLQGDWRAAVSSAATDLGYQDWVVAILAQGIDGWLTVDDIRTLKPGDLLVVQLHGSVETGDDVGAATVSPGDILLIEQVTCRDDWASVTLIIIEADEDADEGAVTITYDARDRAGVFPLSRNGTDALSPPAPGHRLFDGSGNFGGYLAVATLDDDQSGLAPGIFRVIDQHGSVRLCGRSTGQWVLSRDGQRVHTPIRDAYEHLTAKRS